MKRYKIGVLINQLEGMYQVPIWKTIIKKARKLNINVIFFVGKSPDSPINFDCYENVIYELAHINYIDGLIFVSGTLVNDIGYSEYLKFLNCFNREIPKVSISIPVKGIPSIVINNRKAMKEIVLHLIKEHNCKRIAYISGPEKHPEAIQRFEGYREALKESQIEFDENLILPGDFRIECGRDAVRTLLYERKIFPDAIVAANDNMALSAFEELKKKGFQIPADILLTGFDNQKDIQFTEPPLTTVRQPLEKEGEMAVDLIYRMLNGENVPELVELDCELIIRQSCGCINITDWKLKNFEIDENYIKFKIENFVNSIEFDLNENSLKALRKNLDLIYSFLESKLDENSFLSILNNILISTNGDEDYLNLLNEIMEIIINFLEQNKNYTLLYSFEKALKLVIYALKRIEGREKLELDFLMQVMRSLSQNIYSVKDFSELKNVIKGYFNLFGIKFFSIVLFEDAPQRISKIQWKLPEKAKISLLYSSTRKESQDVIEISTKDFFPQNFLPENFYYLGVLALYNRDKHFGYIITNLEPRNEILYVYLQENLGLSMRLISLWEEQKKSKEEIELANRELEKFNIELKNLAERDSLTALYNRRGFFNIASEFLKQAKEKGYKIEMFFIDLDNLKVINDTLGHLEGDDSLIQTAQILKACFRRSDLVARVGGDEFVAIALNKKNNSRFANLILKRINNELKKYNSLSKKPYILSLSIGNHSFNPYEVVSIEHMLTVVDERLYIEKKRKKSFRE